MLLELLRECKQTEDQKGGDTTKTEGCFFILVLFNIVWRRVEE